MKDKAFARAVPREHLKTGAELMGLPLDAHVTNVIVFMRERADALGLARHACSRPVERRSRLSRIYQRMQAPDPVPRCAQRGPAAPRSSSFEGSA